MIPLQHIAEVAALVLAAHLIGCSLGYAAHRLLRSRRVIEPVSTSQPVANQKHKSAARRLAQRAEETAETTSAMAQPSIRRPPELPAPRNGRPDDLKKIKGIGGKTESALHDLGIYHFDQIAAWNQAHVDWLEGRIAIKGRIRREQWIEQATLLATETRAARAA